MREFCNPMNVEYKYQHYHDFAHRESADPTLVYFKGKYYIFASMGLGFYCSDDLINWDFHQGNIPEPYGYAPDVCVVGDYLIFCASSKERERVFWRTKDPMSDEFEPCFRGSLTRRIFQRFLKQLSAYLSQSI